VFNGQVIASSDRTIMIEGNHYFPPEDVDPRYLRRMWMKSLCVWKGRGERLHRRGRRRTRPAMRWWVRLRAADPLCTCCRASLCGCRP